MPVDHPVHWVVVKHPVGETVTAKVGVEEGVNNVIVGYWLLAAGPILQKSF